jgi:hypothetical protein
MAMGTRGRRQRQEEHWYRRDLVGAPGHPFYRRLNDVLEHAGFDQVCEARCRKFYHEKLGRPSQAGLFGLMHVSLPWKFAVPVTAMALFHGVLVAWRKTLVPVMQ